VFTADPRLEAVPVAPGHVAWVIDDALADPQRWVDLAAQHRADFAASPHNAYPGVELRMPEALSARLAEFFARHVRARLGARRTERCYSRLSLATRQPHELEPRQWIAHRDRLEPEPGKLTAACVLYLFHDASLGGTGFYVPRRPWPETRVMIHESGQLSRSEFEARHGVAPGYQAASNAWFGKTAAVAPRWNRLVFYDGGAVFHGSDITAPEKLCDDPRAGRLTLNGFFVCRAAAGVSAR
jgi:hypothetical protein